MHRTGGRCKLPRYRSRSRPTQAREPKPPFFRVPPFPNCAKSIQARPRLSFTATYRSQQMEQGASDGPLYKQLRGQADQRKKPPRRKKNKRRQLGLSEESAQHTRTPKSTPRAAYAAPHCSLQQLHERRSLARLPSPRSVDWNEPADCCHSARIPKQLCYTERRAALSFRSTKSTQTRGWPGGDVTPRPSPPLFRAKNCNDEGRTGKQKRRTRTIRRRKTPINVHRTQKPAFIDVGCKLARLQSSFQGSGW